MADKRTTAQLDRLTLYPATPPETASPDSPTPSVGLPVSRVDKIIAEIHNRIGGRVEVEEEWWCISLSRDEFKTFESRFATEGDYRWPKYDYFPQLAKFVLRMAGIVHEDTIGGFETLVTRQLFIIEQSNDQVAADFARGIRATRSPKIERDGGSHNPDGSFKHKDATELGVILEVSHSQKRQDLTFLADEYILGSNGLTQAVIGIDLEYRKKGKEARVMVWRPNKTKKEISTKKTFEDTEAEAGDEVLEGRSKRQMVRPSPERLTTSDEKRFEAAEEEVKKQLSDQDGDYISQIRLAVIFSGLYIPFSGLLGFPSGILCTYDQDT
ncbi:hypothetical protein B0H67DRAFT_641792 [Lasiosphaeris hirsuta]|uniref:Uncharacterized protein n=1 Tax=Lasiosphaeris hirsuta TaxID=260670 RepID=A0AA40E7K2_9PEZI|nr:hypothetical protein B0H67DRAFT_641792 [Lasiosphaeris hirsuta]